MNTDDLDRLLAGTSLDADGARPRRAPDAARAQAARLYAYLADDPPQMRAAQREARDHPELAHAAAAVPLDDVEAVATLLEMLRTRTALLAKAFALRAVANIDITIPRPYSVLVRALDRPDTRAARALLVKRLTAHHYAQSTADTSDSRAAATPRLTVPQSEERAAAPRKLTPPTSAPERKRKKIPGNRRVGRRPPKPSELNWQASSLCIGGNCVETADLPDGGTAMRDSKNPDGPHMEFTAHSWAEFLAGARSGDFDVDRDQRPPGQGELSDLPSLDHDASIIVEDDNSGDEARNRGQRRGDGATEHVLARLRVIEILGPLTEERTKAVLALTLDGMTPDEIVEILASGKSTRAVEGVMHRWRTKQRTKINGKRPDSTT